MSAAIFYNICVIITFINREPHIKWLKKELPKLKSKAKPITFIQKAGEVVYIPEGWYHATMSIGITMSVAQQPLKPLLGTPYYFTVQGEEDLMKKNYKSALRMFKEGLKLSNEKDFNLMRKVGEASEKNNLLSEAERAYRLSIELNKLHPAAYVELVGLLYEQGKNDSALEILETASDRDVNHDMLDHYGTILIAYQSDLLQKKSARPPLKDACINKNFRISYGEL